MLGTVPRGDRTTHEVVVAIVSDKKEERKNLSTLDGLKLVKATREVGACKITPFESHGQWG